ncbi:MAG TPA: DUF5700 domain-containing putative Zn-dependent protease [Gemmatimonadales bacterium]|nr:DUF5700 domain-containing putative Zn-dependent protease [Gemmatimonadales bacterium]
MPLISTTLALAALLTRAWPAQGPGLVLTVQDDEARAALAILDTLDTNREPSAALWTRLWTSNGYRKLQRRETAMRRPFTDSSFMAFLRSDSMVARRDRLRHTLAAWRTMNLQAGGQQALRWLPAGARIRATVYLLIKPKVNSFVFETASDPSIMLFLDPDKSVAEYTNHVVHELHHIGYASACPEVSPATSDAPGQVRRWLGAFGEGLAMLAAVDGPRTHPHASSEPVVRARWDRDVANFDQDLRAVENFVRGVLEGRIAGDSIAARAGDFYGVQGPWYTVGWKMAAVIVAERGRDGLVAVMCDPVALLRTFNRAVPPYTKRTGERLATWEPGLLNRITPGG